MRNFKQHKSRSSAGRDLWSGAEEIASCGKGAEKGIMRNFK